MAVQSARHRHHTLIQSLLSRGPMKEADFRSIVSQLTAKTSGSRRQQHQKLFNECLRKINSELSYVQLELRARRNQYDGEVVLSTMFPMQSPSLEQITQFLRLLTTKALLKLFYKKLMAAFFLRLL